MSQQEDNIRVVQNMYNAVFNGEFERLADLVDPDLVVREPEPLPYGGKYEGIAGLITLFNLVFKDTWAKVSFEPVQFTSGGDYVITYFQITATAKKGGRSFSFPGTEVLRLKNGKIAEINVIYWDPKLAAECHAGLAA